MVFQVENNKYKYWSLKRKAKKVFRNLTHSFVVHAASCSNILNRCLFLLRWEGCLFCLVSKDAFSFSFSFSLSFLCSLEFCFLVLLVALKIYSWNTKFIFFGIFTARRQTILHFFVGFFFLSHSEFICSCGAFVNIWCICILIYCLIINQFKKESKAKRMPWKIILMMMSCVYSCVETLINKNFIQISIFFLNCLWDTSIGTLTWKKVKDFQNQTNKNLFRTI